jgi:twitching motility protein PilT
MNLEDICLSAYQAGASDVHLSSGGPVILRVDGELRISEGALNVPTEIHTLFGPYLKRHHVEALASYGHADTALQLTADVRLRVNLYRHSGGEGGACRFIPKRVPSIESLGLPVEITSIASESHGLILVTGATGSGKSTTLAAMLAHRACLYREHLITIEDPIEFVHSASKGLVTQREVGRDVATFPDALRAALREDPDVLLVGELRDLETVSLALTAAETGHLVLASLHTRSAASSVHRIIDVFPASQQAQIQKMLSDSLTAIVSQELHPRVGGGRIACTEILRATPAVRALIRDGKVHQLESVMQMSLSQGMKTRESHHRELVASGDLSL